jgi:hypothetical protein
VQQCDLKTGKARWFDGGQLNVSYNCIDRHLAQRGEQTALLWEGDDPRIQGHHLPRTAPSGLPPGQCAESRGVKKATGCASTCR